MVNEVDYEKKFKELFKKYEKLLEVVYAQDEFIVEGITEYTPDDVAFRNNTCVYNRRLGRAYSATEIVEILNKKEGDKHIKSDFVEEMNEIKKEEPISVEKYDDLF